MLQYNNLWNCCYNTHRFHNTIIINYNTFKSNIIIIIPHFSEKNDFSLNLKKDVTAFDSYAFCITHLLKFENCYTFTNFPKIKHITLENSYHRLNLNTELFHNTIIINYNTLKSNIIRAYSSSFSEIFMYLSTTVSKI